MVLNNLLLPISLIPIVLTNRFYFSQLNQIFCAFNSRFKLRSKGHVKICIFLHILISFKPNVIWVHFKGKLNVSKSLFLSILSLAMLLKKIVNQKLLTKTVK